MDSFVSDYSDLKFYSKRNSGGGQGVGARENRGREGYGRREKEGREAGSLRWREAGEKFKKASFLFFVTAYFQSKKRTQ